MDPLFLIERDFGKLGYEGSFYREWTRSKVIDLCAFLFRNKDGSSDVVRILEIRMDAKPEDITEEIMREAEAMRADCYQTAAE